MKKRELIEKYGQEWYNEHILNNGNKRSKEYYYQHKEEIKAKRVYNKEKKNKYSKTFYQKNKNTGFRASKSYRAYILSYCYKKLDVEACVGTSTLDKQWIIENVFSGQVCHYCGETDWRKLGCDRLDNSKPHTKNNCVVCCKKCNTRKHTIYYGAYMLHHTPQFLTIKCEIPE